MRRHDLQRTQGSRTGLGQAVGITRIAEACGERECPAEWAQVYRFLAFAAFFTLTFLTAFTDLTERTGLVFDRALAR